MLLPLLSACLLLSASPQETAPDKKKVEETLADLESAFDTKDKKVIQAALERAGEVPHPKVVKEIQKGLRDPEREIQQATIQALRWCQHADALKALHKLAGDREWMGEEDSAGWILKAIGQHGHPSSLKILAADPTRTPYRDATRARILGLANIRSKESVDALLKIMATSGRGNGNRKYKGYIDDFRLALIVLTGNDKGRSPELWEEWWRNNKKTFRVAPKAIELPRELRYRWYNYWGLGPAYERKERREDRGS